MLCRRCGFWTCKCGQRTLARFLVASVLIVVTAIAMASAVDGANDRVTCKGVISSQGVCLVGPSNGGSK